MAAYAEDYVLRSANVGKQQHSVDAETTLVGSEPTSTISIFLISRKWRRGNYCRLLAAGPDHLRPGSRSGAEFRGRVSDSGEGR
jgi:hypothetical protein